MKDTYCSHCGMQHRAESYPKLCGVCDNITWDNPIPVVVCVQPVLTPAVGENVGTRSGLLIARRAIEPHLGKWALIGGHIESGEDAETAARREFKEELGIDMGEAMWIEGTHANGKGHILIEAHAESIFLEPVQKDIRLCPENSEWAVLYEIKPDTLCFPIHQAIAERFFGRSW